MECGGGVYPYMELTDASQQTAEFEGVLGLAERQGYQQTDVPCW